MKRVPPISFGYVEENLTRSGLPISLNFSFLESLNLKKIIFLASESPDQQLLNFIEDHNIELINIGNMKGKNEIISVGGRLTEENVITSLEILLDPDSYPCHIMCNLGRHKTGTIIGCFRKLQKWNLTSILFEYRRYAANKVRVENEQFIELFDTDLVKFPNKSIEL
jgi:tyrosine-protein phosphatase OCA1